MSENHFKMFCFTNYDFLVKIRSQSTYYADPPSPHKQRDSSTGSEQIFVNLQTLMMMMFSAGSEQSSGQILRTLMLILWRDGDDYGRLCRRSFLGFEKAVYLFFLCCHAKIST